MKDSNSVETSILISCGVLVLAGCFVLSLVAAAAVLFVAWG